MLTLNWQQALPGIVSCIHSIVDVVKQLTLLLSILDGFHLSELNFPALSLACTSPTSSSVIPQCLYLSESLYAFTTAIFTVGGLLGSLSNPWIVSKYGLRGGISLTGWINLFGAGAMTFAPHWVILAMGRLVTGVASGLAISLVPPYLSTIAKSSTELVHRSGQIGTMNQMAIVLGICSAQVAGLLLTGEVRRCIIAIHYVG